MGSLGGENKVIVSVRVLKNALREWNKDSIGIIKNKSKSWKQKLRLSKL